MTKEAVLKSFWSSFGLRAYEEHSVPQGDAAPSFPYITYQVNTGSIGEDLMLTGSIWYRSSSWSDANAKAREVSGYIGRDGRRIKCDGGIAWIRRGKPFSQCMGDTGDDQIRRVYINIVVEFATAD